jgi:hypothetical protein
VLVGCAIGFIITVLFTRLEKMGNKKIKRINNSAK